MSWSRHRMRTIDLQAEAQQEYKVVFLWMVQKEILKLHNIPFAIYSFRVCTDFMHTNPLKIRL
jgi:hypothetical protein